MKSTDFEIDVSGLKASCTPFNLVLVHPSAPKDSLVLKAPWVSFEQKTDKVLVKGNPKQEKNIKAIKGTWNSLVDRLRSGKTWTYRVEALYRHFPVTITLAKNKALVYNFMGLKKEVVIDTSGVVVKAIDTKTILVSSIDRTKAGNVAAKFDRTLRYRTHLRKMDRRRLTDGFLVTLVENED